MIRGMLANDIYKCHFAASKPPPRHAKIARLRREQKLCNQQSAKSKDAHKGLLFVLTKANKTRYNTMIGAHCSDDL